MLPLGASSKGINTKNCLFRDFWMIDDMTFYLTYTKTSNLPLYFISLVSLALDNPLQDINLIVRGAFFEKNARCRPSYSHYQIISLLTRK